LAVREAATYGESESRISTFQSAISKLNKFLKAKPAPMPGYPGEWSELKEVELLVVHLYARFVAWMETTPLDGQAGSSLAVSTILEYNRCVLLASKKAIELGYKQSGKALSEECRRFFVVLEKNAGNTWLRAMEDSLRRRAIQARDAAGQMPVLSTSAIAVPADKLPLCFHALYSEGSPAALQRAARCRGAAAAVFFSPCSCFLCRCSSKQQRGRSSKQQRGRSSKQQRGRSSKQQRCESGSSH
jgi:hypothetical protein